MKLRTVGFCTLFLAVSASTSASNSLPHAPFQIHFDADDAHRSVDSASHDPSFLPFRTLNFEFPQRSLFLGPLVPYVKTTEVAGSYLNHGIRYQDLLKNEPRENLFQLFGIHQKLFTPNGENSPSLINSKAEFRGISDIQYGYCWGFATLIRNFQVLAFFQPEKPRESLKFYKNKIDHLVAGEAVIIPGFKNFREFSLVPELELYLKLYTMELWRSHAVNVNAVSILRHADDVMNSTQVDSLIGNLESRLARGEFPKIIFSSVVPGDPILGMNTNIHVVLVYGVERLRDASARILLWDVNFYGETLEKSPKFFAISPERKITYDPWLVSGEVSGKGGDQIGMIEVTPENDAETVQHLLSLKKFCSSDVTKKFCEN